MKLLLSIAIASAAQVPLSNVASVPLPEPVVVVATADEPSVGTMGNPYRCALWRITDRKKYQELCR
ncbi:hypothetical protein DCC24_05610 [Auritidibacter sp. NML100628]|nr:hypothetical protein DCC24_05610 [Auritidibacter sp. NML100628]